MEIRGASPIAGHVAHVGVREDFFFFLVRPVRCTIISLLGGFLLVLVAGSIAFILNEWEGDLVMGRARLSLKPVGGY